MKYCSKCKRVSFSDNVRCECGGRFSKKIDYDSPVHIITAEGSEKTAVKSALTKADIPYSEVDISGYSPSIGKIADSAQYLVPLGYIKTAITALADADLMKKPEWFDKIDVPADYEWREMPALKRNIVRGVSVALFLALIWACVAGVDLLADLVFKALGN